MINLSPQLSQFILTLYQGASQKSLAEFKSWAFEHMQSILPFDSGLWLSRSDMVNPIPTYLAEDTYLFNQPADFMKNYHRMITLSNNEDPLHKIVLTAPCKVFSLWDAYDSKEVWYKTNFYQEHSKVYEVEHMLAALFSPSGNSNLNHLFSFYRKNADNAFSAKEQLTVEFILPHLVEAFRINVLNSFTFDWQNGSSFRAATDRFGKVIEAENGFRKLMCSQELLIDNDITFDIKNLNFPTRLKINNVSMEVNFYEGLVFFEVSQQCPLEKLTKKQKEICKHLVSGLVDKEICRKMAISKSGVRYHLANIYKILVVDSRYTAIAYLLRQELD